MSRARASGSVTQLILYHANSKPGRGCGWHRAPRAQPFTWNVDGTPNFGLRSQPTNLCQGRSRIHRPLTLVFVVVMVVIAIMIVVVIMSLVPITLLVLF